MGAGWVGGLEGDPTSTLWGNVRVNSYEVDTDGLVGRGIRGEGGLRRHLWVGLGDPTASLRGNFGAQ